MILLPIISAWMSIEGHRRLAQVVPDAVLKLWNKWELQVLVLISLVSQMVLAILGNRKKFRPNIWRRTLVWTAYMMADWVATFAMGVITSMLGDYYDKSSGEQKDINPQLIAFWAPFFLIHLGGPDSITAYALEDNELWLRHLVGLVTQTAVTFYIILLSWKSTSWLSYLSIPMLIIGFIKYGERTWSLYSVSAQHLRDSLLSWKNDISQRDDNHSEVKKSMLQFLGVFVSLFVDMILSSTNLLEYRENFTRPETSDYQVFKPVNFELGLMYDVFYTKAFVFYNFWGVILRLIILFATANVLLLHIIFTKSSEHLVVDCLITYMLLVGSVILEFYSFILMASSVWIDINWPQENSVTEIVKNLLEICGKYCAKIVKSEDWKLNRQSGQADFLTLICNENEKNSAEDSSTKRLHDIPNPSIRYVRFSNALERKIFSHYQKKLESDQQKISPRSGYRRHIRKQLSSIPMASNLEFHQTIIAWHIATDLCYYHDDENDDQVASNSRTTSKQLSDYMFYLLVKCRHMLPVGSGLLTYHDTFKDAKKHFPKKENLIEACRDLLQMNTNTLTEKGSMSVFFHACTIARELLKSREDEKEMWESLDELWIEILSYASANCRVDNHAQQLRKGVEFLSHIWLLQAHLSLLEQFEGIMMREEKKVVACRESGHVVASWFLEHAGYLQEENILRRDTTGSWASRCLHNVNLPMTKERLFDKLCIALGFKVAEEVLLGTCSTGWKDQDNYAEVRSVISTWFNYQDARKFLDDAEYRTRNLIEQHKEKVVQIAVLLFEKEVISKEDLFKILRQQSSDQPTNYEKGFQNDKEAEEITEVGTSSGF